MPNQPQPNRDSCIDRTVAPRPALAGATVVITGPPPAPLSAAAAGPAAQGGQVTHRGTHGEDGYHLKSGVVQHGGSSYLKSKRNFLLVSNI